MKKPTYKYPEFVTKVELDSENGKRYWLALQIAKNKTSGITVILKNPSRANEIISDKTVFNVCNYIHRNRKKYPVFNEIGEIIILNLIPIYMTESRGLKEFKKTIIDKKNVQTLNKYCKKNRNVIIAWGNHPRGLYNEYEVLKSETKRILIKNKNNVHFVDRMTKDGNPKHGQIWGYKNELIKVLKL
tara:strand:+ start:11113 stop:11673 length:561 start_codon:yes stop_codon:yes gene_type:complete